MLETGQVARCDNSNSWTGRSKAFLSREKDLSILLAKFIKLKNSLVKMVQSPFIAQLELEEQVKLSSTYKYFSYTADFFL